MIGALIVRKISQSSLSEVEGVSLEFGICIAGAIIMLFLLKILPDNASIEEAQSLLFYKQVTQDKVLDTTVDDLSKIKDLA